MKNTHTRHIPSLTNRNKTKVTRRRRCRRRRWWKRRSNSGRSGCWRENNTASQFKVNNPYQYTNMDLVVSTKVWWMHADAYVLPHPPSTSLLFTPLPEHVLTIALVVSSLLLLLFIRTSNSDWNRRPSPVYPSIHPSIHTYYLHRHSYNRNLLLYTLKNCIDTSSLIEQNDIYVCMFLLDFHKLR